MEGLQDNRRRSPSVGHQQNHNISHPAPSPHFPEQSSSYGLDPTIGASAFNNSTFDGGKAHNTPGDQYSFANAFLTTNPQSNSFQRHTLPSNDFGGQDIGQTYKQGNENGQQKPSHLILQESNHEFSSNFIESETPTNFTDPFQTQNLAGKQDPNFDNVFMLDPSLPSAGQPQNQSINPAEIMGTLSSPQGQLTPNLMQMESRPSPRQSPGLQQGQFYSPGHSRNTSLDPARANFPQHQQQDWTGMLGGASFQQHRRAPSEHSDVSSSVAPSPYLAQQDSFETFDQSHSPMLSSQQDSSLYQPESLGIERFSLSDAHQQQQRQAMSPRHSPYPSPRMVPHQGLGISEGSQFILSSNDVNSQYGTGPGPHIYTSQPEQSFSNFSMNGEMSDMGQAAQMAPPEINVELAPPSRPTNFEHQRAENNIDALSPPENRGRRGRLRAKSDPSFAPLSRDMTPAEVSPHLVSPDPNQRHRSLSPFDGAFPQNLSRDSSPNSKSSRRSSTSSIPNRDYILELADPSRPSASGDGRQRVQKHPATFQCTLCPKRFTRAYNLRSHLRTHTDERPFVCTVCGKAFARQHDRKRHEGLHSGEKKFVCRGELGGGGSWGCGRRFARADALGRHFRSEAGRVCIKPLLDEEAMERHRLFEEQMLQQQQGMQAPGGGLQPPNQAMDLNGGFTLPAALLAQYPALQGLQWDQLGAGGGPGDDGELSGRSSFDASSGGEYFEDDEGGYVSGPGTGYGNAWGANASGHEWASDYEGR